MEKKNSTARQFESKCFLSEGTRHCALLLCSHCTLAARGNLLPLGKARGSFAPTTDQHTEEHVHGEIFRQAR